MRIEHHELKLACACDHGSCCHGTHLDGRVDRSYRTGLDTIDHTLTLGFKSPAPDTVEENTRIADQLTRSNRTCEALGLATRPLDVRLEFARANHIEFVRWFALRVECLACVELDRVE